MNPDVIRQVFDPQILSQLEELEIDDSYDYLPRLFECRTLHTLTIGSLYSFSEISSDSFNFPCLKILKLIRVDILTDGHNIDIFSKYSNLENLNLTACTVSNTEVICIGASKLKQLSIIDNKYEGSMEIYSPSIRRVKFDGLLYSVKFTLLTKLSLDEVKLEMYYHLVSHETTDWMKDFRDYIFHLTERLKGLTKSFDITFNFFMVCILTIFLNFILFDYFKIYDIFVGWNEIISRISWFQRKIYRTKKSKFYFIIIFLFVLNKNKNY